MINIDILANAWKPIAGYAYILICIFDFIVVPAWYGLTRPDIQYVMDLLPDSDISIQLEYLRLLTDTHDPYTLKGGGLIHVAFGALLTGSILNKHQKKE